MIWPEVFVSSPSLRKMYLSLAEYSGKDTDGLLRGLMRYHCSINGTPCRYKKKLANTLSQFPLYGPEFASRDYSAQKRHIWSTHNWQFLYNIIKTCAYIRRKTRQPNKNGWVQSFSAWNHWTENKFLCGWPIFPQLLYRDILQFILYTGS